MSYSDSLPLYSVSDVLRRQLPRALQERLSLGITGDPFGLHVLVVFVDIQTKRRFNCRLEETSEGELVIPLAFIAHLCAVV
jgi:hypothetical protein